LSSADDPITESRQIGSHTKELKLVGEGQSYREINHRARIEQNTVLEIVMRERAA
jgi:hypothetical protein